MHTRLMMSFLLGALGASVGFNVVQYRDQAAPEENRQAPSPYQELDLTPAQIRILNECGTNCCDAVDTLREQSSLVTEELRVALTGLDFDREVVQGLADELCSLRNQEVDNNIATLLEVRNVLKPGQLRELYHLLYPDWED